MNKSGKIVYQFNDFQVDAHRKCLWRENELVSLTPKAFDTLIVLLRHRGQVVEKDFLLNEVWADTFVEEATLAQNISTLRKTLGGEAQNGKQLIETIPRRGYRFAGEVKEIVSDEEIIVLENHTVTKIISEQEVSDGEPGGANPDNEAAARFGAKSFFEKVYSSKWSVPALLVVVAVSAAGLWLIGNLWRGQNFAASKFNNFQIRKLSSNGNFNRAAISPDGNYLALVERKGGQSALLVQQTSNTSTLEIVPFRKQTFAGVNFSPDNHFIYYSVYNPESKTDSNKGILYKIPVLGGTPQKVSEDVDSPVAFSPDKQRFAFIRNSRVKENSAIIIASLTDNNEKILASRPLREPFALNGLAWSPDGKTIASAAINRNEVDRQMEIVAVDAESGEQKLLMPERCTWIGQIAWLKDGSGVVFPGYISDLESLSDAIWIAAYPSGKIRRLTRELNGYMGVSITSDSNQIATIEQKRLAGFWVSPSEKMEQSTRITNGSAEATFTALGMSWTPDDKIVYASATNGNVDIWKMNSDGGEQKRLTFDAKADFMPSVSADGKYIVFLSSRSGSQNVWRMNSDGTEPKQITDEQKVFFPNLSPDGKWVYYTVNNGAAAFLWKISSEGGDSAPIQLTSKITRAPKLSPDGTMITCYYPDETQNNSGYQPFLLSILSAEDGRVIKQFREPALDYLGPLGWTHDSRAVTFVKNSNAVSNLWLQPVEGGEAKQITNFQADNIGRFAWSADGKKIAYEKISVVNNVILMTDSPAEK